MNRSLVVALVAVTLVAGLAIGAVAGGLMGAIPQTAATSSPAPSAVPSITPSPAPPTPSPRPTPTPTPSPKLFPAPLTGMPVAEDVARRHVVAVIVDDYRDARPQSGFSDASVVWHAPAEGGIPRYMLLFGEGEPPAVGPVRSARHYFIAWAAEWRAMYVHVGGSPLALRTLRSEDGRGGLVYDADQLRYGGTYLWRIRERAAPHNVYTDFAALRALLERVGAADAVATAPPPAPVWQFGPDAPEARRPEGGRIEVPYPANRVVYAYDRASNTYLRSVAGETAQVDRETGERVAPKNVVVILMRYTPLGDGSPKRRQEADVVGGGTAYIATNGVTIKGTWSKASIEAPTLLFDASGAPVTMTRGQTFVQVVPLATKLTIEGGRVPLREPWPGGAGDLESRGPVVE